MKIVHVFCLMLVSIGLAFAEQKIDVEFSTERGKELILDLQGVKGEIEIEGWDDEKVSISGHSDGRRRDDCRVEVRESNYGVRLDRDCRFFDRDDPSLKVDLQIRIPRNYNIELTCAASTKITGVEGNFDIEIGNASLEVVKTRGRAKISTANGRLTILDSDLQGQFKNVNGRFRVRDSNLSGEVSAVNSRLELDRANSGIEVSTVNGSIDLGAARNFVSARTVNGSLEIAELQGRIDAETVNGNVTLAILGKGDNGDQDIQIETLNGRVELELPEDFSMDVDITIKNDDGRRGRYEIISDFDFEIDNNHRRYDAVGRGVIAGGKNKVRIDATNGDVYLRKGS